MYECWTILVIVIMHVPCGHTAVATLPRTSSDTRIDEYVHDRALSEDKDALTLFSTDMPDDVQLGCKELRAKRFISDGFCTSLKAIKEVVCAGQCMPIKEQNLPWWAEFTKYWAKPKLKEWRCEDAVTKLKKVQLMCRNGETRTYKIKIVKSCRCKSYEDVTNRTERRTPAPVIDVEKERKKLEKLERQERKRLKREKRLEREREKRAKRQLRKSSRESRKHRHSGDRGRRHERRRHKNNKKSPTVVDAVSDTRHRISKTFTNNDSPTV